MKRWHFDFSEQWSAIVPLLRGRNWRWGWADFTVFELTLERSAYAGSFEVRAWALGLGGTITYVYDLAVARALHEELDAWMEEIAEDEQP